MENGFSIAVIAVEHIAVEHKKYSLSFTAFQGIKSDVKAAIYKCF